MNLKRTLTAIVHIVLDEAEQNLQFRQRLTDAILQETGHSTATTVSNAQSRKGGRRTPALLDPVELARGGEALLRQRLIELDQERLRDIVAQFGMDPGKLVMKWKDRERVIDRIVEISLARSTKGDAFRAE